MIFDITSSFTSLMKTIIGGSSELHSSAHAVVSNDDLLIEILLRLPTSSLRVFKTVSKRWLTLITTDPSFTLRRSQLPLIDPPSGLIFVKRNLTSFKFVSLDIRIPTPTTTFGLNFDSQKIKILQSCNGLILSNYDSQKIEILQSCNGLILCKTLRDEFVYNPSTNRFKTIPKPPYDSMYFIDIGDFRMAFDPSKSPHYKIIYARQTIIDFDHLDPEVQIHIYSSETCKWSVCSDRFLCYDSFKGFRGGVYCNGGIHWLQGRDMVLHHKLDVEHPSTITTLQTPCTDQNTRKLFESGGCLLLCTGYVIGSSDMRMHIYEMCKRRSVWVVKYIIDLDDVMMKYPKIWKKPRIWLYSDVRCIVIGKREEDSFLVIEIFGMIIQYKIASKTIRKLYELVKPDSYSSVSFEFIASFADA